MLKTGSAQMSLPKKNPHADALICPWRQLRVSDETLVPRPVQGKACASENLEKIGQASHIRPGKMSSLHLHNIRRQHRGAIGVFRRLTPLKPPPNRSEAQRPSWRLTPPSSKKNLTFSRTLHALVLGFSVLWLVSAAKEGSAAKLKRVHSLSSIIEDNRPLS